MAVQYAGVETDMAKPRPPPKPCSTRSLLGFISHAELKRQARKHLFVGASIKPQSGTRLQRCTSSNSKRATHTSVLLHYQTQQVLAKQQSLVEAKNYAPTAQMILFQSYRVWTHRERQSQVGFSRHRSLA
jgi:hypothetical protein